MGVAVALRGVYVARGVVAVDGARGVVLELRRAVASGCSISGAVDCTATGSTDFFRALNGDSAPPPLETRGDVFGGALLSSVALEDFGREVDIDGSTEPGGGGVTGGTDTGVGFDADADPALSIDF